MSVRGTRLFAAGTAAALAAALLGAAGPGVSRGAYPDKPPLKHTGGFGEATCLQCHLGAAPNAAGGALSITGVPDAYRSGVTYRLAVRIARAEMVVGGFQLAARFADGAAAGRQAGTLRAVDGRAQVSRDTLSGVQYASQTKPGAEPTAHWTAEWSLDWTAPATSAGPVVFHLAANAGNGDESALGDFVYWKEAIARAPGP